MTLEEMQKRLDELNTKACEIQALADLEKRDLKDDEADDLQATLDEFDKLEGQQKQRKRLEQQTNRLKNPELVVDAEPSTRQTDPATPGRRAGEPIQSQADGTVGDGQRRIGLITDRGLKDPKCGWRSFGEYAHGVIEGSRPGARPDERLLRAALTTFGSEGVGADGGFSVPPDFRDVIMEQLQGEDSLLPRTDQLTSGTNNLTVPKDETTPWQTSGGILANWIGEGAAITQSKPSLETVNLKLHKLAVLVPITDELQEDSSALSGWLSRKAPQKINFAINLAIVQGLGTGQPLGILNAAHTVSVAKTASQDTDSFVAQNVIDMYSRMYAPWRRNAAWLINQDIEPQLNSMSMPGKDITGTATSAYGQIVYLPANGLAGTPWATLYGRPVIPTQACETLGDKGDIIFAALDQYVTVQKVGGIRSETSIHLWFDQDTTAFKFIMRIAGQPWWNKKISARDGTTTYSAFVTLDERG
ncbi:hypothetical protein LCGC14_0863920 [marine sediment metagenome]|uniref:Phage capsid-like C-terminal domain-containing protein n=1 Tax=marine sediment metagenome TaxID=412755 RepID=A0A0F9SDP1_9ZZZZ